MDAQPLFGSHSLGAAHGKAAAYVQAHAGATALVLSVLIVLVIILLITTLVYHKKWKKATGDGFRTHKTLTTNTTWWPGSISDQAAVTNSMQHYSQPGAINPAVHSRSALQSVFKGRHHMKVARQKAAAHRAAVARARALRREGLDPGPTFQPTTAPGNPLDDNTGYEGDEGGAWAYDGSACPTTGVFDANGVMAVDTSNIGAVWDPEAITEAQALAAVGSYAHDPSGDEQALQAAISSVYDSNTAAATLTDAQLQALMAQGTAP